MSCFKCDSETNLREKARVEALEKQNTDLVAIVSTLLEKQMMFRFVVDPNQEKLRISDYQEHLAKQSSRLAKAAIEQMLEDRRQLFYDHSLLRAYAGREYWEASNKDFPR